MAGDPIKPDDINFAQYLEKTDPALSLELEQQVLGHLLMWSGDLAKVPTLAPEDFADLRHRPIFRALKHSAGDIFTVLDTLRLWKIDADVGGLEYLHQLTSGLPIASALEANAARIQAHAVARAQAKLHADAQTALAAGRPDQARAFLEQASALQPASARPTLAESRMLDWRALQSSQAPSRHWFRKGWLTTGATLLAGGGGMGKSALVLHEATTGALARPYFAEACDPYRSLVWCCEDDHDELWRRQEGICAHEGIAMAELDGLMYVESRVGCDNALMAEVRGEFTRTRLLEQLRAQVNDLGIDVLWLDNAAHVMAGNHDDRGQVTAFVNALSGLVVGRPFSVVVLGHVARMAGSEFTGSVAWENAVRMRWFLGSKLPDQSGSDGDTPGDVRYLAKRKANYAAKDYARLHMKDGLLLPETVGDGHISALMSETNERRAEEHCIAGFKSLCAMGVMPTDGQSSPDYLPTQIVSKGLAPGYGKPELARAMNRLMGRGKFIRAKVGCYANRSPRFGLQLVDGGQ